ncbi:MAG: PhzF family phenazine biosynthesis isomerase [Gammaproteobacteria bacterium]|nr:PhzF family phenazine biosynthesis isomerase [Gammaproteobacteria bacterium]
MDGKHRLPVFQVDAFTNKAFSGNPAAVCLLPESRNTEWMQGVAAEINLSETAFVTPCGEGFELRWLTPTVEVDLCGHATLASAHVLWEEGILEPGTDARFHTKRGWLQARQAAGWIELDFPAEPVVPVPTPEALLPALGIMEPVAVYRNRLDYLVHVASASLVRDLSPDFARLKTIEMRGVMVTARADDPAFDFVSRFFAPATGIDEDPVTGSAHCALYPYWHARLNKPEMTAFQESKRGGLVKMREQGKRVILSGQAITVMSGELHD